MSDQKGKFEAAFPCEGGPSSGLHPDPGMSIRDWFAGQALAAIGGEIGGHSPNSEGAIAWAQVAARRAYAMADAMLAERVRSTRASDQDVLGDDCLGGRAGR